MENQQTQPQPLPSAPMPAVAPIPVQEAPPAPPSLVEPPPVQQESTGKMIILLVIGLLLVAMVGISAYYLGTQKVTPVEPEVIATPVASPIVETQPEEGVACTLDAMQCPDGSYVGRTGPDCEFVCPGN